MSLATIPAKIIGSQEFTNKSAPAAASAGEVSQVHLLTRSVRNKFARACASLLGLPPPGEAWHQSTGHLVCSSPGAGQGREMIGWGGSGIVAQ